MKTYRWILSMSPLPLVRRLAFLAAPCFLFQSVALASAAPTSSTLSPSFTPHQRREIVSIVRMALKQDPTILGDALRELQESIRSKAEGENLAKLSRMKEVLRTAPAYAVRGNPAGKLTVVEFYDPRCGYCRAVLDTVDRFIASEPHIRFVEKVIPVLGDKSSLDAEAILAAAQQGAYATMKKALMLDKAIPTMDHIREIARKNGLDLQRFDKDMKAPAILKTLQANLSQARAIGLEGTPTFVIGDSRIIPGAVTYDELKQAVHNAHS